MRDYHFAQTPPMGWNSWNTFYNNISESLILEMADAMCQSPLKQAGYEYIIIDDCWQAKSRDAEGNLQPDPEKFPHGMKYIADYLHERGLKFGIYSCCGTKTCAGYPGSFEHEFKDASQFASWGVDYLKYDNCHKPQSLKTPELYRRMGMALRASGRDIFFAACQWGTDDIHTWARSAGINSYRSTIDITDSWSSVVQIVESQLDKQAYCGPYCYNDMDMLIVGMDGKGENPEASMGGCTATEYQTHFALWTMMNSPLIIGCDIRNMSETTKELLTNEELIRINQDIEGRGCYQIPVFQNPDALILVRPLTGGDYALGFFNFSDIATDISLDFWDMGLSIHTDKTIKMYDCFHKDSSLIKEGIYTTRVNAHGSRIYRCSIE